MKKLDVPQSGSQASTVASRNRFGQYNRTRAIPTNPSSQRQMDIRGLFASASQAWRTLSDATRISWNAYAGTVTRIDSLGQTVYPSGHQVYVGQYVLMNDLEFVSGSPDIPEESPPSAVVVNATELSNAPEATITINSSLDEDLKLQVESSAQVSAGISYNQDYRFLAVYDADTGGVVDILSALEAKFGSLIAGKRIFFRLTLVSIHGGAANPTEYSLIVGSA